MQWHVYMIYVKKNTIPHTATLACVRKSNEKDSKFQKLDHPRFHILFGKL